MEPVFSIHLFDALAGLIDEERGPLIAALAARTRHPERYEMLLITLGWLGVHRLYLGDRPGAALRCALVFIAIGLAGASVITMAMLPLICASACGIVELGVWIYDYKHIDHHIAAWHALLEARVLAVIAPTPPPQNAAQ